MPTRDRTDAVESPSDRFERLAAAFYYETGIMAPGKDDALGTHDYDARVKAWREWCAVYGDDLQVGLAGFGRTPAAAMEAFDTAYFSMLPPQHKESK